MMRTLNASCRPARARRGRRGGPPGSRTMWAKASRKESKEHRGNASQNCLQRKRRERYTFRNQITEGPWILRPRMADFVLKRKGSNRIVLERWFWRQNRGLFGGNVKRAQWEEEGLSRNRGNNYEDLRWGRAVTVTLADMMPPI